MATIKYKVGGSFIGVPAIKGDKGDAGAALPDGGTANQIIIKNSATEQDATWQNNPAIMSNGSNSAISTLTFSNGTTLNVDADRLIVNFAFPDGTKANLPAELWYAEGKYTETINEGDNVMLAGSQGQHYLMKKAVAAELAVDPHLYLGVATKSGVNTDWGKVTRLGLVNNINTNGWAYGTLLYYDPVTNGFTSTLPALPNARIEVGMVVRQGVANGVLLMNVAQLSLYTNAELDALLAGKANTAHIHAISDVTGLQTALDGKVDDSQVLTNVPAGAVFTDTIYTLPVASATLGGIKSGTDITVDGSGNVSVVDASHNHIIDNVDGLQAALDAKAPLSSPALVTPTVSGSGRVISNDTATGTAVYEIWSGTQAQYNAIGTKDANTLYFIV